MKKKKAHGARLPPNVNYTPDAGGREGVRKKTELLRSFFFIARVPGQRKSPEMLHYRSV